MKAYIDSLPTCGRATELAGSLQRLQHDAQALVLDRKAIAKLGTRQHRAVGRKIKDLLLEPASPFRPELANDLQMGRLRAGREQLQIDPRRCRYRTVLAGEDQVFLRSPEIEVRVAEGMDIAGAAHSLADGDSSRGVLARVMQQQDRDVEVPLQLNPSPLPSAAVDVLCRGHDVWVDRVNVPFPRTLERLNDSPVSAARGTFATPYDCVSAE